MGRRHCLNALLLLSALLCSTVTSHAQPANEGAPAVLAAARTWGAVLNPTGAVPPAGFKAIYISTQNPRQIVASEIVPEVAINYAYADFHGIKSEDFGAYWVGRMTFAEAQSRIIEVAQGWSKARVIVDGRVVYEGGENARTPFTFTEGEHLVEVEYVNNWHTTSFRVAFSDTTEPMGADRIRAELERRKLKDAEVHYVGLYDTNSKDLSVRVNIASSPRPIVLVLSSYEAVKWVLEEANPGTVRAIVHGSFTPGSQVTGVDTRRVPILRYQGRIGTYDLKPRCACHAAHYHCENSGTLLTTLGEVEKLTGAPLASFNGAYSAVRFFVPGRIVTAELKAEVRAANEQEDSNRQRCRANANPDFERMFDEAPRVERPCIDLSKPACVKTELQRADETLNARYSALLKQAAPERARQLRTEQRKWISERDTACGLPAGSTAQTDWIATLAQDQSKALCVYGSTLVRIEQLRK